METGVPEASIDSVVQWTVGLFGARAPAVFEAIKQCPQATELPPLLGDSGLPTAAAVFVIEKEWAVSLGDLIERRLMVIFAPRLSSGNTSGPRRRPCCDGAACTVLTESRLSLQR